MKIARTLLLVALAAGLAGVASADTVVTTKHHSDGFEMMGHKQPAKDTIQTMWLGKGMMRMDGGEQGTVLVRNDQKKMYILDDKEKTAYVVDLPITLDSIVAPDQKPMVEQMMQMMKMQASVTPGTETQKIKNWNTRKFTMTLSNAQMKIDQVMWVTKDVKLDMSQFKQFMADLAGLAPFMAEMAKEIQKIDGFPVLTETTTSMMGTPIKSREEVQSVEDKAAPAGNYDVPAGYKTEPFNFMDMQKKRSGM